jgi:hypothetical protein
VLGGFVQHFGPWWAIARASCSVMHLHRQILLMTIMLTGPRPVYRSYEAWANGSAKEMHHELDFEAVAIENIPISEDLWFVLVH